MGELERLRARVPGAASVSVTEDPKTSSASPTSPNTFHDLVVSVLDQMNATYTVDGEEIYGRWESGLFQISDLSDDSERVIVHVHGTWERYLLEANYTMAVHFCNEWNSENVWPKSYAQVDEDHRIVGIFGETTVDMSAGVTTNEVDIVVEQGIGNALALFKAAAEAFPDAPLLE